MAATAGSGREQPVRVDLNTGCLDLAGKLESPGTALIQWLVEDSSVVRRQLDLSLVEYAHPRAAQAPEEEAHLQEDILTCAKAIRVRACRAPATTIIRPHHDHRQ